MADFGGPVGAAEPAVPDPARLAALLGVADATRPILLTGAYARAGAAVAALVDAPQVWLDAPADARAPTARVSRLTGAPRLPLGVDTIAAAAVDAPHAGVEQLARIRRALHPGGRLVAPVSALPPGELRELARDADEWVAEATTRASGLIDLRRQSPPA